MAAMGNAADLFPKASTPRHGVQGTVTKAPDDELDTITVGWDADGDDGAGEEQVVEVGVPWASNGRLPDVGDTAILFNDDRGDPHAVVFATGDRVSPDSTAAVSALDTRVDALEAKRTVAGIVAADGTESSPEFSVVKNATGDYTVTFSTPFASAPTIIPGVGRTSGSLTKLKNGSAITASSFSIYTYAFVGGALMDAEFTFIASGAA